MLTALKNIFYRRGVNIPNSGINKKARYRIAILTLQLGFDEKILKSIELAHAKPIMRSEHEIARAYLEKYLMECEDSHFLTAVEIVLDISLEYISNSRDQHTRNFFRDILLEYISNVNRTFKIENIDYSITESSVENELKYIILPTNSAYLHQEVVEQSRKLLINAEFKGPLEEFDKALRHHRDEDYDGAILEANNAYESTLKSILTKELVVFNEREMKVPQYISKIKEMGVIPDELDDAFAKVWSLLSTGPNTIRNQPGAGHGQGLEIKKFRKIYADFVMHAVGTYIVFLVNAYREYKNKK